MEISLNHNFHFGAFVSPSFQSLNLDSNGYNPLANYSVIANPFHSKIHFNSSSFSGKLLNSCLGIKREFENKILKNSNFFDFDSVCDENLKFAISIKLEFRNMNNP